MIITDKFVVIAFPKAGSNFVSQSLKELYEKLNQKNSYLGKCLNKLNIVKKPFIKEILSKQTEHPHKKNHTHKHGRVEQIPKIHSNKLVLSTIRNPFERYVSLYEYKWWKIQPIDDVAFLKTKFPKFPDMSFKDFMKYHSEIKKN